MKGEKARSGMLFMTDILMLQAKMVSVAKFASLG
jgi:hypothetical protein